MSIFVDAGTRLLVQGITGREGAFHTRHMLEYGTAWSGCHAGEGWTEVRGASPDLQHGGRSGAADGCELSVIYVPPMAAAGAIFEAVDAGIKLVVCITEGIPVMHMSRVMPFVRSRGARLIGPNCPGLITPGASKVGIIPGNICTPGRVGLVSRSGTLTYEVVNHLTRNAIGQSTCVGIGGDPIIGTDFIDCLASISGRPGYRRHCHDRRNRRHRRAERGAVRQGACYQACDRFHRGTDRAQGPAHGTRRRNHLRLLRHRRRKARRLQGGRTSPSCAVPPTLWDSCARRSEMEVVWQQH